MVKAQLLAERATLLARLAEIEEALRAYSAPAVELRTRRNLRNTAYPLTTRPEDVGAAGGREWVLVYSDEALTQPAAEWSTGGWVSGEDAARLRKMGVVDGDRIRLF